MIVSVSLYRVTVVSSYGTWTVETTASSVAQAAAQIREIEACPRSCIREVVHVRTIL